MLSSASVAGFGVQEAIEQPHRVERVHHEDTEKQLSDGTPFRAAIRGLGITRCQHGAV